MSERTDTVTGEPGDFLPDPGPLPLTRAELRADLPTALRVGAVVVVAGLLLGVVWALVVPGVGTVVLASGASGSLPSESDHVFDQVAVFVLLIVGYGVVAGAVAWRRRAVRGPVALVGVVVAALVGAWLAGRLGVLIGPHLTSSPVAVLVDRAAASGASGSTAGTPGPPLNGSFTTAPPSPGPWWTAFAAGLAAALTYLLAAILDGHEDPRGR